MIYLERRPARQWKRGICGENTMLYSFSVKDYMGVSFERLGAIFDPKPPKHTEKMYKLMMEGQRAGVALNHQFGLWNGEVYIYNRVIGKHTKDTVTVDEMFVQELKDVIRDLNLDLKVEAINAQAE
jgi:hypothetical protein